MLLFLTIFVLAFMAIIQAPRVLYLVVRVWVWMFVQANSCAKCPCCGIKAKHKVTWSASLKTLAHICTRCAALWTEKPMVDPRSWQVVVQDADYPDDVVNQDGTRTTKVQHAQREPMLSYAPTGKSRPIVRLPRAENVS